MDNPAAPIPSLSPQPAVPSLPDKALATAGLAETSSPRWPVLLIGGLSLLIFGIAIGLFSAKFLNQSQTQSQLLPTPTLTPDPYREQTGSAATANWKIYRGETAYTTDGSTLFQISYPPEWAIEKNILYPLGRSEDKGLETVIILGAGGHGWAGEIKTKEFPAGIAKYSWVNSGQQIFAFSSFEKDKYAYIIEVKNLPLIYEEEYKILFDQILSTFEFSDQIDSTSDWKIFSADEFSLKIPSTWTSYQSPSTNRFTWDFSSGLPGRSELIVSKLNTSLNQLKSDVLTYFSSQPNTKQVTLGETSAIEYYGCAGVEGCINQYILLTSFAGSTYKIDFTPYPDQEANLYQNIISNFKFAQ